MLQFYFLAIFVNLIGGIYFANDFLAKKFPRAVKVAEFFENGTSKFIFAIVAGITGLFLIISVTPGDVAVVGDLLIAITSFIICLYFLKDTITKNVKPAEEVPVPDAAAEVNPDAEAPAEDAKAAETAEAAPKAEKKKVDFGKACGSFYSAVDKFKTAIGILAIALAVLHFCFPAVVLI
ncbi:MAG: hypothetical protein J6W33_00170 [Spirochaetia bacterium]|nr:hypothetical protein [Spirochaetia bacterium]MBO7093312.1 hypothetical protein [Spirochaetia bacterium]MBO7429446.1 hypothetical protein [Spirochaetia bacterium]MBO7516287.1 hypothetical protein [Spirochaetia bacterium]MBP5740076.1 hypothetical protein [Spirochaetia bacterium]